MPGLSFGNEMFLFVFFVPPLPLARMTSCLNNSKCCCPIFWNFTVVLTRGGGERPEFLGGRIWLIDSG